MKKNLTICLLADLFFTIAFVCEVMLNPNLLYLFLGVLSIGFLYKDANRFVNERC